MKKLGYIRVLRWSPLDLPAQTLPLPALLLLLVLQGLKDAFFWVLADFELVCPADFLVPLHSSSWVRWGSRRAHPGGVRAGAERGLHRAEGQGAWKVAGKGPGRSA